jgi:hypothetical protein
MTATDWASGGQGIGHYAEVNGLHLYFETHGAGRPLILLHGGLQRVAPRPGDFPRLLDKMGAGMAEDFDFTEGVRGLRVPTMIVAADADMAPPSHYIEVFQILDGGLRDGGWMGEGRPMGGHALAILPGLTHYNIFSSPLFSHVILAFLDDQPS